jgi:hypothetical protein
LDEQFFLFGLKAHGSMELFGNFDECFLTGCGDGCVFKNKAYPLFPGWKVLWKEIFSPKENQLF